MVEWVRSPSAGTATFSKYHKPLFGIPTDQWLPATDTRPCDPEMPREQPKAIQPTIKLSIEFCELLNKGLLQGCGLGCAHNLGFERILKHGYR